LKAFSAPKGKSSQTPLSSDIASFGTQGAFSEPNFNDQHDYVTSLISVLEDDEQQLKMIRANQKEVKKRKSKIPTKVKNYFGSLADEKDNDDDDDDVFPSAKDS
jgi:hypothetical protein